MTLNFWVQFSIFSYSVQELKLCDFLFLHIMPRQKFIHLAFFINLQQADIGPSATLMSR